MKVIDPIKEQLERNRHLEQIYLNVKQGICINRQDISRQFQKIQDITGMAIYSRKSSDVVLINKERDLDTDYQRFDGRRWKKQLLKGPFTNVFGISGGQILRTNPAFMFPGNNELVERVLGFFKEKQVILLKEFGNDFYNPRAQKYGDTLVEYNPMSQMAHSIELKVEEGANQTKGSQLEYK